MSVLAWNDHLSSWLIKLFCCICANETWTTDGSETDTSKSSAAVDTMGSTALVTSDMYFLWRTRLSECVVVVYDRSLRLLVSLVCPAFVDTIARNARSVMLSLLITGVSINTIAQDARSIKLSLLIAVEIVSSSTTSWTCSSVHLGFNTRW